MHSRFDFNPKQCNPKKQFTCWNGHCIPLWKRCNEIEDCTDGSDEERCTQVKLDESKYRMTEVPRNPKGYGSLKIELSFHLKDIVEINEPQV